MTIERIQQEIRSLTFANSIILDNINTHALDKKVNLHSYEIESGSENLGDYLSRVVVDFLLNQKNISLQTEVNKKKHLYAIGSIILMGYQNCTIWGTGLPYAPSFLRGLFHREPFRKLDIRAVRGPYTRKCLLSMGHDCPSVYGDPAVLLPLIYRPNVTQKTNEYIIIPHFSTEERIRNEVDDDKIVSMNTTNYKNVIDRICSAERVISSSLHGIILAESYGTPAVFFEDRPVRFDFKYEDWYASTDRKLKKYSSIASAISSDNIELPDLEKMRERLIDSFPYDLWEDDDR